MREACLGLATECIQCRNRRCPSLTAGMASTAARSSNQLSPDKNKENQINFEMNPEKNMSQKEEINSEKKKLMKKRVGMVPNEGRLPSINSPSTEN